MSGARSVLRVVARALGSARAPLVAALVGVALASPSLFAGLQTEDHVHRHAVGLASFSANLFGGPLEPMDAYGLKDAGLLPWITVDDWSLAFFRPLTAWTHVLDYAAWPDRPWVLHAHSLAWFAALLYVVGRLHRRLVAGAPWAAGLASLLYAVDDGHGPAVGWVANRGAIIATAGGALALLVHDRWRREGWRPGGVLGPVLFATSLAGGELAVGYLGFLLAYVGLVDRAPWPARARSAAAWIVVALLWAAAYRGLGYGARGSSAYVDPIGAPWAYARAIAERFPLLLQGLFGAPSTDFVVVLDRYATTFVVSGVVTVIATVAVLGIALRRDRRGAFWAAGTLLSLLPACTALPSDRLLFVPGIGAMALLASAVERLSSRAGGLAATHPVGRAVLAGWAVLHLVSAPILLPWRSLGLKKHDEWIEAHVQEAFATQPPPDGQLVIVNAPDFYTGALMVAVRSAPGRPTGGRPRVLYGGDEPVTLRRVDETTLEVRPARGFMVPTVNTVYRSADRPLWVGHGIQLTGMQVTVTEADRHGAPTAAAFRFDRPLESPTLVFVAWNGSRYERLVPPRGAAITIPAIEIDPL